MRIARVDGAPFEPPFPDDGDVMSNVVQQVLLSRTIRLVTEDGHGDVGKIVRKSKHDPQASIASEDAVQAALDGLSLADLPYLLSAWRVDGQYSATNG